MRIAAYAKLNFGLVVHSRTEDGFHPLESLTQSISINDDLEVVIDEADPAVRGWDGEPVPDGDDNLAWRAVQAARQHADVDQPLSVRLRKHIPVASGLGGGSADAAAALVCAGRLLGVSMTTLADVAPQLGSDVPFCLRGGSAVMRGRGEVMADVEPIEGFAVGVIVPPLELATPAVYAEWDRLGEPTGPIHSPGDLPPPLRPHTPLRNDLYPAAVSLSPRLAEWRDELAGRWGRNVAMSGSGSALYAFFVDVGEAEDALGSAPVGARFAEAAVPVRSGWMVHEA